MIDKKILCSDDAWRDEDLYNQIYDFSIKHPEEYWAAQIDRLSWVRKPTKIFHKSDSGSPQWFADGKINACYNCVDRHAETTPEKTAIIWQNDDLTVSEKISFQQLKDEICKFANVIKKLGIKNSNYVTIYMPMIPEAIYACLACARLGLKYTVVFSGFSPDALALRMNDCGSEFIISCDANQRGGKSFAIKKNIDKARKICQRKIISLIVKKQGTEIDWDEELDNDYYAISSDIGTECEIVKKESLSELFMLYTSGSVGKPKGVIHGTGGFLLYALMSFKYFFDICEDSVFWCSGDIGWMGGHAYAVLAPLANGTTTVIFEGIPTYPTSSIFGEIIDKHQITSFNTAPTVLRAIMQNQDAALNNTKRDSLRLLGVFGEILNKDDWEWYFQKFGKGRSPVINMWGQTELGGVCVSPFCNIKKMGQPGNVGKQFFGCEFEIRNDNNEIITQKGKSGNLFIKYSMPGMMTGIFGETMAMSRMYYDSGKEEIYCAGDGACFDIENNFWITGRNDDVLNVSGHRISPIEIEETIAKAEIVLEAAVVGFPHKIKGEGIFAFVVLHRNTNKDQNIAVSGIIKNLVAQTISPITKPDIVLIVDDLPKTISGKIMRRILRLIAAGETENFGDLSTIVNPDCILKICKNIRINSKTTIKQ